MSVTKTEKDKYPKLYGYGSIEQLQSDPENKETHWVPYKDADGDLRFIPCAEKYFHQFRNEQRNEFRRRDTESRCLVHSELFGLVKCRADCSQCSKTRDGFPISIDYMRENYDLEFSDGSFEEEQTTRTEDEQKEYLWKLVSEFNETDQLILKYYNDGKTDAEIAAALGKARSTIQEKRVLLTNILKEKYEKFKK